VENLGGRSPSYTSYATGYGPKRRPSQFSEFADRHYNYEDESQDTPRAPAGAGSSGRRGNAANGDSSKPFSASWMTGSAKSASNRQAAGPASPTQEPGPKEEGADAHSIDNIARFFGGKTGALGKPGAFPRSASSQPPMDLSGPTGASGLKRGQRVRHSKYGEGTVLIREGEGEDAKLTVMFSHHGMKKLMEKFANLRKI
jgi:DNA helicase-2/ATP-dependent DNA helicase PcrA